MDLDEEYHEEEGSDEELSREEAFHFRSQVMRAAHYGVDRPEIQYATKELAKEMAKPKRSSLQRLKRLGRYLLGVPRVALLFAWRQKLDDVLVVEVDADFAGCLTSRKSSSGLVALWSGGLLKSSSKSQTTVAMSTSESEFYSILGGAACALGLQSLLLDLGFTVRVELRSDASAAISLSNRRGLGKARHICVGFLWIQEVVSSGRLVLKKINGLKNRSDLLTKHLSAPRMKELLSACGCVVLSGRHPLALSLASA